MHPKNTQNNPDNCPVAKTLRIMGSKWTFLLIHHLLDDKKRFNELQRLMAGISPKTLSQRLKDLEKEGIISKKVFAEVPPRVEYTLTPKGQSLKDIFGKMAEWGEKN